MSSHLDGNGNFVPNINRFNHTALTENDRMWNAEIERALQGNTSRTSGRTVAERELAAQAAAAGGGGDEPQSFAYGDWSFVGPTGDGAGPMLQFLREDIPRQIGKYGTDTNIFGTNCPMYDVIIDEALKLKFLVAEQCCPTPTKAYPTVMALEISNEDAWDFDKINNMIREKSQAAGMTNRLGGWPMPVTVFMPQYAVELAKKMIEDPGFDYNSVQQLNQFAKEVTGHSVTFSKFKPAATGSELQNYNVMIMDSILY